VQSLNQNITLTEDSADKEAEHLPYRDFTVALEIKVDLQQRQKGLLGK
jgi:hypothetical protein